ncbi:hypothetical protein OSTOST_15121, partial [Ostertagia ostertagi]
MNGITLNQQRSPWTPIVTAEDKTTRHREQPLMDSSGEEARIQSLRIEVEDVDEPPAFVNGPVPFLTVVPLETPVGFHVYKFVARDEGGDGDDDVDVWDVYGGHKHRGGSHCCTAVQRRTTYRVLVQAVDKTPSDNATQQVSEVAKLEILAGDRPPQFLQQHYTVSLPEDVVNVVDVRAHRFRAIDDRRSKGELTYSVWSQHGGQREATSVFGIDPKTGVIHLRRLLDYDDPSQPKLHKLIVVANEDDKESSVTRWTRPLYTTQVREDFDIGKPILTVRTEDKDSGDNARVKYSVDNGNFTVNDLGEISAKINSKSASSSIVSMSQLQTSEHRHLVRTQRYTFVQENTNDEAPVFFPTRHYTAYVAEDAQGGTPVVQIQ